MRSEGHSHLREVFPIHAQETWERPIDFVAEGFNPDKSLKDFIEQMVSSSDNFLGKGGAGKVFTLGNGTCIKLVLQRHTRHVGDTVVQYDLGNSAFQEVQIQRRLGGFRIKGVFAPSVLGCYTGADSAAIVMEELDAVNLQMVLNSQQTLPERFELDTFFDGLEDYIEEMHDTFSVVHGDLEPRNIMIDRKTGVARVIDFGRSFISPSGRSEFERDRLRQVDISNISRAYDLVEKFIQH